MIANAICKTASLAGKNVVHISKRTTYLHSSPPAFRMSLPKKLAYALSAAAVSLATPTYILVNIKHYNKSA